MDTRPDITSKNIPKGFRRSAYEHIGFITLMMLPMILIGLVIAPDFGYSLLIIYIFLACIGGICQLYDHIKYSFKTGWKIALAFLPITAGLLVVVNRLVESLNNPILNFQLSQGLLGGMVSTTESSLIGDIFAIIFLIVMVGIAIPIFNFYEEYYFRKRWVYVPIWALLHLFLGFSGFTVGALLVIFVSGIVFKVIWDKYGFQKAYACHVLTNWTSIAVAILIVIL